MEVKGHEGRREGDMKRRRVGDMEGRRGGDVEGKREGEDRRRHGRK